MSDDIRIKKAVYESVKDMFALAVSGSRFKLKSTSYEASKSWRVIGYHSFPDLFSELKLEFWVSDSGPWQILKSLWWLLAKCRRQRATE